MSALMAADTLIPQCSSSRALRPCWATWRAPRSCQTSPLIHLEPAQHCFRELVKTWRIFPFETPTHHAHPHSVRPLNLSRNCTFGFHQWWEFVIRSPPKNCRFLQTLMSANRRKSTEHSMLSFIWEVSMILRLWLHAVQLTFGLFKRFFLMSFSPEGFPLMRIVMGKWEGPWVWMVPWTGAVFVRYRAKMMSNTVAGCGLRMPCRCIRHTPPQTHACLWKQEWLLSSTTLRCPINIFVQAFVCVQAS